MGQARRRRLTERQAERQLTDATREAVADAVHEAVCEGTGSDGFEKCAYYSYVGAVVCSAVTGNTYLPQIGTLHVGSGDVNDDGELMLEMRPSATGYSGMEFHAWCALVPPGLTAGVHTVKSMEVVDFSMRHYPRYCERVGVVRQREPLPEFFWGSNSDLQQLGVWLQLDPVAYTQLDQFMRGNRRQWEPMARSAVHRLRETRQPAMTA